MSMRIALINPRWRFDGSIYFGCRDPHLPLELGYAKALLEQDGHQVLLVDGHLEDLSERAITARVAGFAPEIAVLTTAPTYLFWRCAQPELTLPAALARALRPHVPILAAIGPHGSTTPVTTLRKLGVDLVLMGEAEELVQSLAAGGGAPLERSVAFLDDGEAKVLGGPHAGRFVDLPSLAWPDDWVRRHRHHHHRFDAEPDGPGAEVEASRGCPYSCSFCAKLDFRDRYRRRKLDLVLHEIDRLIAQGVTYLYFIDEIFLPQRPLLEALIERPVRFGVQTRSDLWKDDLLELLGAAGCVSIEAGVESITEAGRAALDKNCRMSTDDLAAKLITAKHHVPFVQANLIQSAADEEAELVRWRDRLRSNGVWANDPVPLFAYPGSPEYHRRFGRPDDQAWERAHDDYLGAFAAFSDIQEEQPLPLAELERASGGERVR
jgi:B12-binding domain/radical SAM domain protein of rhizo-twelve system